MIQIVRLLAVVLILNLFFFKNSRAQVLFKEIPTREIIVSNSDSIVRINVMVDKEKIRTNAELFYYWYYADHINANQGGYSGHLLHGEYRVFNSDNQLISKGSFHKGNKNGEWKRWFDNGSLMRIENWDKGKKSGVFKDSDISGNLLKEKNYKDNLLHGVYFEFAKNDTISTTYKNGVEITSKDQLKIIGKKQ